MAEINSYLHFADLEKGIAVEWPATISTERADLSSRVAAFREGRK